jgi:predicted TIM-barrel fold metal-dependent hydrolase
MVGKIAFEEHFAVAETFQDTKRFSVSGMADDLRRRLLDIQEIRLGEMDEFDIEFAIQSLNSPGIQGIPDTAAAVELARRTNDILAGEVAKRPDRFAGFAALPMQDPDAAVAELARCVNDLGFKGALLNGYTQKDVADSVVYFDLPEYRPVWAMAAELDVPVYLHPRNPIATEQRAYEGHPWLLNSAWAFAVETAIAALRLLGSGLFDEYPSLQLVIGHLGERIPFDLWRVDHRIRKSPQGIPAKKTMAEYFRSNVHLTTSGNFHDSTFHFTVAEVGIDRVMFSVDYPFETTAEAVEWFDKVELSDADRTKIARTNAIELFKLDLD